MLEPWLLEVLVAPDSREPLHLVDERTLYDPAGRRAYRIDDGIPVLLAGEARAVDDAEHTALSARIAAAAAAPPVSSSAVPPVPQGPGA